MSEGTGQLSDSSTPAASPSAAYRCFLFADLRGYTSYIEKAGNSAGVELVRDYLAITRAACERFHGAEIKVEGDGFHAVFPSASSAVMCGLAIIDAAREATEARPDRPIRVGVGIHAGEAVETPEGFIGSAVNMAARVCAAAQQGEVLVTGTVRAITQSSIDVGFVGRGRQRLKGINEPVELFAVTRDASVVTGRRSANPRMLAAIGLGAVALMAVVALAVALPGLTAAPATPTPAPTVAPLVIGPLDLGTHVADQFNPPFSFTVADTGWGVYRVYPDALGLEFGTPPEGHLDVGNIPLIYGDPCGGDAEVTTGTSLDDLFEALASVPYLQLGEVRAAEIGGNFAKSVDITIDPASQAACASFSGEGIRVFPVSQDVWRAMPGEIFRLQATEVDATVISFLTSADPAPAQSVDLLEAMLERADRIVQSIEF
jgi:class 3 adenylate cyclase